MLRYISLISCLMLLTLTACSDKSVSPDDTKLVGSWTWTESFGGNLGYMNPENCHCSSTYEFTSDHQFTHYFSGEKLDSGTYTLTIEYSEFFGQDFNVIYLNDQRLTYEFRDDRLIFLPDWKCLACPDSSIYIKSNNKSE